MVEGEEEGGEKSVLFVEVTISEAESTRKISPSRRDVNEGGKGGGRTEEEREGQAR